jgi:micrococcal nuclease
VQPSLSLVRALTVVLALLAAALAPAAGHARSFDAKVLRVIDGDSIVVRDQRANRVHEIRLAGIDAPELGQPWGIQSRTALRRMVDARTVRIEVTDRDRYNRLVARVWQGRTHVNAAMARNGHAWAYGRNPQDSDIRTGQNEARAAGRGLWSLPPEQRIPPATWRARTPRA